MTQDCHFGPIALNPLTWESNSCRLTWGATIANIFGPSQAVNMPTATPNIHQGKASFRCTCPPWVSSVLKIKTAREGVIVKALTAEIIVETAMVTARSEE